MDNLLSRIIQYISFSRFNMVILLFLLFLVVINVVEGFTDHYIQRASNHNIYAIKQWHIYDAMYKVLLFGAITILASNTIFTALIIILSLLIARWVIFEITLNLLNGSELFYIGKTALIDKLFHKLPHAELFMATTKFIVITIIVLLYLYI